MNISRFTVHRPIFTVMVTLIVIILGAVSFNRLPIDLMPDITYPTVTVRTRYENASPEEIEELITRPVEEAMSAVPGVEEVSSNSSEGSSNVRVTFTWGTNLDEAANDIRDRLDRVIPRLPDEADRPTLFKFDLASFPILIMGASSKLDPIQMREIIDDQVKVRIERLPGVAALDVRGGLEREIHVNLFPEKIKALGLPLDLVMSSIRAANVNLPAGSIDRGNYDVTIRTPGYYTSLDELRNTIITTRQGMPIHLREIASVEDRWKKVTRVIRVNGEPGFYLAIQKQSGTNTVEVAQRALKEIQRINQDIPQIKLTTIVDTSDYIQRAIHNVGMSALWGGGLAVFVLLLFLRSARSTTIIATAIPISIIATFALMYFSGFTVNIMTLGGLALGVGMLVDNSIVVLENIYRLREAGERPTLAAVAGSEEVTGAIIASTLTTLVVFLPLVFVRGMAGMLFKQLALVVGFSLLCSVIVAVSLVPMLCAKILPREIDAQHGRETLGHKLFRLSSRFFNRIENGYKQVLHVALAHRFWIVVGSGLALGGTLALIPLVGAELMPDTDEGEVRVYGEMDVGTRLDVTSAKFEEMEKKLRKRVPEMKSMVANIGGSNWRGLSSHTGSIRIALKPQAERKRSSKQIADDLRKQLRNIPGMTIRTRAGQGLFIMRMATRGGEKIAVEVRGYDLDTSDALAARVRSLIEGIDGVTDIQMSREAGTPEEQIVIDRQKAADMKLNVSQVANMLQTVLSGTQAGYFRARGNEYGILVKVKDAEKHSLKEILDLTLTNGDGEPVVLRNVVAVRPRRGPVMLERKDQERINTLSVNISDRDMGYIIHDIREKLRTVPVPRDFLIQFGGDYEERQKAFRELLLSFVLALILVYMVMACQFESLRDPFVVMFSVPLAVIGVVLILFLTNTTFNVQSFIGCIMLGGIVVNNAILLVDYTNLLRRRDGMPMRQAIEEAGRRRLRPILMTALTTILGLVPLALGVGEGGEAQAPMARAVIGGLLSSTLITLIFIPTMYSLFERRTPKPETAEGTTD